MSYVQHGQLPEAVKSYQRLRSRGSWPHPHAMNALINAHASNFRLGDVVTLVAAMAEGGMEPDAFTFSAILNACQRADESELGLDVFRVMRQRGMKVDDVHATLLLRMCYNRLRQMWQGERKGGAAGGPMPGAGGGGSLLSGPTRTQEREKLLMVRARPAAGSREERSALERGERNLPRARPPTRVSTLPPPLRRRSPRAA